MSKSRRPFHLADDRIERAVGVLRRREVPQPSVWFAFQALHKRSSEPRFANTCLAGQEDYLAFADLRL
jgi:hypothetical protein